MPVATRREVIRTLLSASIGGAMQTSDFYRRGLSSSRHFEIRAAFTPIRDRIRQAIARGEATGLAVAVSHRGSIVWEEGFGWADREAGRRVTSRTPFSMASITKPFTATTLVTLVAEGRLTLEEPANKHLSTTRIKGTNGDANDVTVRQLGAHISGLPAMFEQYSGEEKRIAPDTDALLRQYGELAYPSGTCYEYSNIGFAALAAIAESLTGRSIGSLMTHRVLLPLGLQDSFFDTDLARLPTGAVRYDPRGQPIPYYTTSTPASGELYASAHDLARFAMYNMKNRMAGRKPLLDDRQMEELHAAAFVGPSGIATTFGWFKGNLASGAPFLFKVGGQPGVANILYMLPSEDLACLVLTNRSDTRNLAHAVCNEIIANYLHEWREPEEYCGVSPSLFAINEFAGRWEGLLKNDGVKIEARLDIESKDVATFKVGGSATASITGMQSEGSAFTGSTTGLINSPDAIRAGAKDLKLKLIPHSGKLVGRLLATSGDPDTRNVVLPFTLSLSRVSL